ncbi:MAG TPA: hypothetical protein VGB03_00610 [Acidimicrobiales bacterium]|jgi:hypothetical protein
MRKVFLLGVVAVAATLASVSLAFAEPAPSEDVEGTVEFGQALGAYATDLAIGMVPVPTWVTDPTLPGRLVEGAEVAAAYGTDLATGMVTVPPWVTDPTVPGRLVEGAEVAAANGAELATTMLPPTPWVPDQGFIERSPALAKAVAEHLAEQRYGGGAFRGTTQMQPGLPASEACPGTDSVRRTVSIVADVAFGTGTQSFVGPLAISGTACGGSESWLTASWTASGSDQFGNAFDCPRLYGGATAVTGWRPTVTGGCTLNGVALPQVQFALAGHNAPVGTSSDTAAAGVLTINTY